MGPATQSDRPSPRGGGPLFTRAVLRARDLIDDSRPGRLTTPAEMADWIGHARVVLEELTRDA